MLSYIVNLIFIVGFAYMFINITLKLLGVH